MRKRGLNKKPKNIIKKIETTIGVKQIHNKRTKENQQTDTKGNRETHKNSVNEISETDYSDQKQIIRFRTEPKVSLSKTVKEYKVTYSVQKDK